MHLFNYYLIRVAGLPFDVLTDLTCSDLTRLMDEVLELKKRKAAARDNLVEILYKEIPGRDKEEQQQLLRIKRDIFNERNFEKNEPVLSSLLKGEAFTVFEQYKELVYTSQHVYNQYTSQYEKSIAQHRASFKETINTETFRKGMVLSSHDLYRDLNKYIQKNGGPVNSKDLKIESGLLKYLTRSAAKTSPFSTFTNLSLTKSVESNSGEIIQWSADSDDRKSYIRLNNQVFLQLKTLLFEIPGICNWFLVQLNPTLSTVAENYLFLASFQRLESFQRIPVNPVLEMIAGIFKDDRQLKLDELVTILLDELDDDAPTIRTYVRDLIRHGFLEYNLGISGMDENWHIGLATLLKQMPGNIYCEAIIYLLLQLRNTVEKYPAAQSAERLKLLTDVYATYISTTNLLLDHIKTIIGEENYGKIKENFTPVKIERLLYEDTSREARLSIEPEKLESIISSLNNIMTLIEINEEGKKENEKIKDFFLSAYAGDQKVKLLTFYEDLFRHEKQQENKDAKGAGKFVYVDFHPITQAPKENEALHIDASLFKTRLNGKPFLKKSLSAFLHFYTEEQNGQTVLKAVVNNSFGGYGKMFSRFVYLFNEELHEQLLAFNNRFKDADTIYAENADSSHFNANIHNPLMDYEIKMPGSNNLLEESRLIKVSDIHVIFNQEKDRLELELPDKNKTLYIFDLDFEVNLRRSELFRLLNNFGKMKMISTKALTRMLIRSLYPSWGEQIITIPRIVFEQQVIIQRAAWFIPKKLLPATVPNETEAACFLRINEWRNQHGFPAHVFINVNSSFLNQPANEKSTRLTRDDYKPQYINFESPLLVLLLRGLFEKVSNYLLVEEMLPHPQQLASTGNKKYTTEFLLQWHQ